MPTGHRANVDEAEIIRLYVEEELSCNQIAALLGYSERVPYLRLKRAGIAMRETSVKGRIYRPHVWVDFTCPQCGRIIQIKPHDVKERRYCSSKCAGAARGGTSLPHLRKRVTIICKTCQQPFERCPSEARVRQYCSTACMRYGVHQMRRSGQKRWLERIVEALLVGMQITYEPQWLLNGFSADFYLPTQEKAIECDGAYWHQLPMTVKTDLRKERAFAAAGIPVLHLAEREVYDDIGVVRERVLVFVR